MLASLAIKATISYETQIDCTLRTDTADNMQKKEEYNNMFNSTNIMTRKD